MVNNSSGSSGSGMHNTDIDHDIGTNNTSGRVVRTVVGQTTVLTYRVTGTNHLLLKVLLTLMLTLMQHLVINHLLLVLLLQHLLTLQQQHHSSSSSSSLVAVLIVLLRLISVNLWQRHRIMHL
jgi:hypothetical protein